MLTAVTRKIRPAMNRCELSYLDRVEIEIAKPSDQHRQYEEGLRAMGAEVISLPDEPELPDSVFVEDPAVVVDEVAILTRPGAESRRREGDSLSSRRLARFRPLRRMQAPATLEAVTLCVLNGRSTWAPRRAPIPPALHNWRTS